MKTRITITGIGYPLRIYSQSKQYPELTINKAISLHIKDVTVDPKIQYQAFDNVAPKVTSLMSTK